MAALNLENRVIGTGSDLAKSPKVPVGFTRIPETRFPESDDDATYNDVLAVDFKRNLTNTGS